MEFMNTFSAQELKRRGISAVDEALKRGAVHIIKNNRPQYVVLSEEQYVSLVEAEEATYLERIKASLQEVSRGKTKKHKSAADLIKKFGLDG
jgi:PHD/YefM family antitoxin component YafN of YafNO toxin-antitoxin module